LKIWISNECNNDPEDYHNILLHRSQGVRIDQSACA